MDGKIRVAILDDHQGIIDGYSLRLSQTANLEVVATAYYSDDMDELLEQYPVDVLLLDVQVPTARDNPNPYPLLHKIPKYLKKYPDLHILIITMHNQRSLIRATMKLGVSGYILKDDRAAIKKLGDIIRAIFDGGYYLSKGVNPVLAPHEPFELSERQLEALSMAAAFPDYTSNELTIKMGVAGATFRNLLSGAYTRLGVRNRTAAILKAREQGLITPSSARLE